MQNEVWKFLEDDPIFAHSLKETKLDEKREIATRRHSVIVTKKFVTLEDVSNKQHLNKIEMIHAFSVHSVRNQNSHYIYMYLRIRI